MSGKRRMQRLARATCCCSHRPRTAPPPACSLLAEENDAIVAAFREKHPDFSLLPASTLLGKQGIACDGDVLRLLPHQHNTDGFFAAALERKA